MARYNLVVQNYKIQVGRRWDATWTQPVFGPAYIHCTLADGWSLTIYFLAKESPQVANQFNVSIKRATIFAQPEQYQMYVDLLRNEKPVSAFLDTDRPEWNNLSCGAEPVGEGEIVTM